MRQQPASRGYQNPLMPVFFYSEFMNNPSDNSPKPLTSFIVIVRNLPANTVRACLDSITELSLRPQEREIIVVDDGSDTCITDELGAAKNDILYIRQSRQGENSARNTGLRMATGRYIQFVSGSDTMIAEGYEHCIDIMRYNDPDMVLFDCTDKKHTVETYYIPEPIDGAMLMRHSDTSSTVWGYAFNRRILLDLRFTPSRFNEDEAFTPQLMLRAERVFSTNIAACYSRNKKKITSRSNDKRLLLKQLNDMEQILFHLKDTSTALPNIEFQALQRRIAQLTLEYIIMVIRLTRSSSQFKERLQRLEREGLFPLPDKDYTRKYMLLRRLTNNSLTRKMMELVMSV